MNKVLSVFTVATLAATSAFAFEIKPYVGVGVVIDKAGTSAKRVALADQINVSMADVSQGIPFAIEKAMKGAFVPNGGDDMDFSAALVGEFTVGVKMGAFRTEFEYALRSASEDSYTIFDGNIMDRVTTGIPGIDAGLKDMNIPTKLLSSTEVNHDSYMLNFYYDFDLANSNWTPYIGAGAGVGTYKQLVTVDVDVDMTSVGQESIKKSMVVLDNNLTRFEWQAGLGAYYDFSNGISADVGYRFNSADVAGEFVYAHELKMGLRYTF